MALYYYKKNDDWYITDDFSGRTSWLNASSVISIRPDGNGQFIKGSRQDLVECSMRKYAAADILYREELPGLALRARPGYD